MIAIAQIRRYTGYVCLPILAMVLLSCVSSAFYQPDHIVYDTPKRAGLAFESVTFQSADGTRLSGWFIPAPGYSRPRDAKGTVVHFHGNAQNMSAHWQLVEWLPRKGFNLFVFDYRGYGNSEGKPDQKGLFEDSNSALNYVRARPDVNPERLLLLGQSLGGANAIAVLGSGNRTGVKAIMVESTFYSYSAIASDKFPGAGLLIGDAYSPERYVANLSPVPFLLLHGTADQVIPYAHATQLIAKANAPKQLITMDNADHLDAFQDASKPYIDSVVRFFETALADQIH